RLDPGPCTRLRLRRIRNDALVGFRIVAARRLFSALVMIAINILFACIVSSLFLQLLIYIAYPASLLIPVMTFFLTKLSIAWLFISLFATSVGVWFLGNDS